MNATLFLITCLTPCTLWAQSRTVDKAKPADKGPAETIVSVQTVIPPESAAHQRADKLPAPGVYQSKPHALRILVPDSTKHALPRARPSTSAAKGIIAPLPKERLQKVKPK
ncbi:hypothetical protein F1C16_10865 [Hymenobacter sp. NBH84]|uniref:hypothetical protein n=1 Tax=Hymenobacter sp. NBH84 TaxID=2596915 RepID=UPI001625EFDD|nr:hypothetical protein [Hymenobacter sp. NBH84]QNE40024.1 hypothetical protein F1C16_10865 [Hymenobacter sp. NBH84]